MSGARSAVLCGIGSWLPPREVDNAELAARLDTSDEWIRSRTGVRRRHVVDGRLATSDLAVEAGKRALKSANVEDVGAVVLATTTPDRRCPATAPDVATQLGLGGRPAFDVNAVCTGFLYGLASGAGLISSGIADSVLVIGADAFSTILDPDDRTTTAIFGDGAGAAVLRAGEPDEPGALGAFDLGSDGDGAELIMVAAGGSRQRLPRQRGDDYFTMQGKTVFRTAVTRMTESAGTVLAASGLTVADVDKFVCHQANQRILDAVAKELGVPGSRFLSNIASVGNTAAASVPLALADGVESGELTAGQLVLLCAFGGGLTWGATVLRWPALVAV